MTLASVVASRATTSAIPYDRLACRNAFHRMSYTSRRSTRRKKRFLQELRAALARLLQGGVRYQILGIAAMGSVVAASAKFKVAVAPHGQRRRVEARPQSGHFTRWGYPSIPNQSGQFSRFGLPINFERK